MESPLNAEGRVSILNVGTRILLKDIMDHHIRQLGDYRTYYAGNLASAIRVFSENPIQVVLTEVDLGDASAYRLVRELGGGSVADDEVYFILALEERSEQLLAFAEEIEVDSVLVKPFSAADLHVLIQKYQGWKAMPKDPWKLLVREAQQAFREKRYSEVESFYKQAMDSAPNSPIPIYKAAMHYIVKPDYGLAEGFLKKAISMKPNYVQALSAMGTLYLAQHQLDKAEEFFRKAHQLSPLNPDRAIEMSKLSIGRAIDACKSALRVDTGNINARLTLAKLLTVQKDYTGAVRELDKAMPVLRDAQRNEAQTFAALARKLGGLLK